VAAVIGETVQTEGFALAGAVVLTADDPGQAHAAWGSLPADVTLVVLTANAAAWLAGALPSRAGVLVAVMRT
jgi:vacuolar-type H+-ATPase subunit F/Vma7